MMSTTSSSSSKTTTSNEFWVQFKSHGPRLVPFFKTLAAYFVIFIPTDRPSLFGMVLKCLPIAALALFVCLHGIRTNSKTYAFSRKILLALIFSLFGDAFLIWPQYFDLGMASFAIAQVFYCNAFGFEKPNYTLGLIIYLINTIGLAILLPNMENVPTVVKLGLPVYSMLLMTMAWRAIDRSDKNAPWTSTCSSIGGIVFVISDMILGFNMFYTPLPHAQVLVMSTYYIAQLFLTLSIVNSDVGETATIKSKLAKEIQNSVPPHTNSAKQVCKNSNDSVKSSF